MIWWGCLYVAIGCLVTLLSAWLIRRADGQFPIYSQLCFVLAWPVIAAWTIHLIRKYTRSPHDDDDA